MTFRPKVSDKRDAIAIDCFQASHVEGHAYRLCLQTTRMHSLQTDKVADAFADGICTIDRSLHVTLKKVRMESNLCQWIHNDHLLRALLNDT